MAKRDYYEVLGVLRNASLDQLKSAYRNLALKFHPDKNQGNKEAEEKFKEVNEAFSVLSDPEKRKAYDEYGHAGVSGFAGAGAGGYGGFEGFGGGFDFSHLGDVFEDIFGSAFGGGRGRRAGARPGRDLRVDHEISLKEVLTGADISLDVPNLVTCEVCQGSGGAQGSSLKKCPDCRGTGQLRISHGFFTMAQTCGRCRGEGQVIDRPCTECRGMGRVQRNRHVRVRIPPGVENGTTLRVAGAGEAGERGASTGDLYVVVRVGGEKGFERDGANLLTNVTLTFPLAAIGGEIDVPSLEGSVRLKIPAGTQPGVHFRVAGHGLPHLKSRHRGDLFVRVQVEIPKKLSREERKVIQDLAAKWGEHRINKDDGVFKKVFGS
ncbi:MAG: molecular chaperone DnaJ [Elusimicrobia bacterium]|nr:molecular chaperone DnaJ [Candidatus Obscuribacterium magneticum]